MLNELRKNYSLLKILIILMIIAVGSYVLTIGWSIISNFLDLFVILLSAWLLSFIFLPIVDSIQKTFKLSKLISTTITYILISILMIAIIFLYIPLVSFQIAILLNIIPVYLASAPKSIVDAVNSLSAQFGSTITLIPSAAQFLFSTVIAFILSFYFIVDREKINKEFFNLVPKSWHNILQYIEKVVNDIFASFLRIQLFFAITTALLTWIILKILNIDFAASIAFLAGIFAFIPLLGPILAIIPPILVALLVDPIKAVIIGIFLLFTQQVVFNVIGPKLLGKAFKLHPAIILISFIVGLKFAGGIGAVFAIPVLGISAVMIRTFGHYFLKVKDDATKTITSL